jgi:N-acetylneuraminic acid mutarotase
MAWARKFAAAATIGNTIYVIGGSDPSNATSTTVQAYNIKTNTWSLRRPLPAAREGTNGATVINGRIYVSGGYFNNTLFVYNPATDSWARKANMPEIGFYGAQGAIGGLLYVYAAAAPESGGNKFWRYNPATNTWSSRRYPPHVHGHGAAGVIGGKLYLAGGQDDDYSVHGIVDVYTPATDSWSTKASLPNPRSGMASAVLNGKLYVAGGQIQGGGRSLAGFEVYDPATNTWSTKTPLPVARAFAAGAAAGRFFVMGGRLSSNATTNRVDAYTP